MNRHFRLLASVLMLTTMLGISSGFTLINHMCLMSGEREMSMQESDMDCCAAEKPEADACIEADCCLEMVSFIKFDFSALMQHDLLIWHPAISAEAEAPTFLPAQVSLASGYEQNLPPPLLVSERLAGISVFRI